MRPVALAVAVFISASVTGCDDGQGGSSPPEDPCENDQQGAQYEVGLSRSGSRVTVEFVDALPAPPAKGNNTWVVKVLDGTMPVDEAEITVVTFMPAHDHGSPIDAAVEPLEESPGQYRFEPVNFNMGGLWETTIDIVLPDDTSDSVMFPFCVDS